MRFIIDINIESDKKGFRQYLLDGEYYSKFPHVKKSILRSYSSLSQKFDSSTDIDVLTDFINDFVENKYQQFGDKIQQLITDMKGTLGTKGQKLIQGLEGLMNYDFDIDVFYVFPTFLPVSTFGENVAKISIIEYVFKNKIPDYIDILIHEISHIVFEKKISAFNLTLDYVTHYYFKEILAPIIVRSSVFDEIRQSEKLKFANPELQFLNISVDGSTMNLIDYFHSRFVDLIKINSFDHVFLEFNKIFISLSSQFKIKRDLFSKIGFNSSDRENSIKNLNDAGYFDPIELK